MIRVHVHQDSLDDEGGWVIYITGHANEQVCAGVSAIVHSAVNALHAIAKAYPKQCSYQKTTKKKLRR